MVIYKKEGKGNNKNDCIWKKKSQRFYLPFIVSGKEEGVSNLNRSHAFICCCL